MPYHFEKYLPWFILREIPSLGNILYKRLIDQFQSPENILAASEIQLATIDNISKKIINSITHHTAFKDRAVKELNLVLKNRYKIITLTDSAYPALLKQINDPPPFLTYLGSLEDTAPCISVIGSRNATSYGLATSENLSYRLAKRGFQVVSGLARGIDAMAHKGALKAGGRTIAVMGSGLNKIYPRENKGLFKDISKKGVVFSEFRVNTDPFPSNFPIRNRIIAGLSCGSIIVEAARRSGSLITARLATEYNREVFAVPGSITSKKSEGTHALLKQGARLVENEMDIMDELHQFVHEGTEEISVSTDKKQTISPAKKNTPGRHELIKFLDPYPVHIDILLKKSRMSSAQLNSQLLDLELKGVVTRHQGDYYSISEENH